MTRLGLARRSLYSPDIDNASRHFAEYRDTSVNTNQREHAPIRRDKFKFDLLRGIASRESFARLAL
jgi:hypothetical protein